MNRSIFIDELRAVVSGGVRADRATKAAYSVDASIYEVEPAVVVTPKTAEEIQNTVQIAAKYGVPINVRGAATGITGGCLGEGVIIDTSIHMNKILDLDISSNTVTCQPGVVQKQLNSFLAPHALRLGPDTSTGNRATIGGMVGNNSAGAHSLIYGAMVDHVVAIEMVMSDGSLQQFTAHTPKVIVDHLKRIHTSYADTIASDLPTIPRRSSGYQLQHLPNPCKVITGSEGSLGVITAVTLNLCPIQKHTQLVCFLFDDLVRGLKEVPALLATSPSALELIDDQIIAMGRISPSMRGKLDWLDGDPQAVFVAEYSGETPEEVEALVKKGCALPYTYTRPKNSGHVWALREAGLGLLMSRRSYSRGIAFVEDLSVPPEQLAQFIEEFKHLLSRHNKEAGIYGHIGAGCIHARPYINLKDPIDREVMTLLMEEVSLLTKKYGGVLSGEHGDGRLRSWTHEAMFGETLCEAFKEVKKVFDPIGIMSPHNVVPAGQHPNTPLLHSIRCQEPLSFSPFLSFDKEGGLPLSADLCNGNGACRKREGVMCPSFQVTGDERETTRARAQAIRQALSTEEIVDVLDLCLECKGCKTECPSEVDMAKMKSEILFQHQEKHGYSFRSRLFGMLGTLNTIGCATAPISNLLLKFTQLQPLLGITSHRSLPPFARRRFSATTLPPYASQKKVVLFNDTYNEFNEPQIGIAAVELLNRLGYEVITPPWTCCGRPMLSKGLLRQAKEQIQKVINLLHPYAKKGIPILGLEPSCISVLQDDLESVHPSDAARLVMKHAQGVDTFLAQHTELQRATPSPVYIHGHCHQKALTGTAHLSNLFTNSVTIPSGCCGMAGAFGYEKEHYALSMEIGEHILFPAVREAEGIVIANGFSCRSQILHGTGKRAYHAVEQLVKSIGCPPS